MGKLKPLYEKIFGKLKFSPLVGSMSFSAFARPMKYDYFYFKWDICDCEERCTVEKDAENSLRLIAR